MCSVRFSMLCVPAGLSFYYFAILFIILAVAYLIVVSTRLSRTAINSVERQMSPIYRRW
ncbi:MAG: DUF948 domain-containing protein [Promethearchaeota archaeon]